MKEEKKLFKLDEMEYRIYDSRGKESNLHIIEVSERARVYCGGIGFRENIISKIAFFKYKGESSDKDSIFVELFMGNIEIATQIYYSDVVIYIELDNDVHGNEIMRRISIREARDYDYKH